MNIKYFKIDLRNHIQNKSGPIFSDLLHLMIAYFINISNCIFCNKQFI